MTTIAQSTILITGGAGGIGRLMAQKMVRRNGNVVLWDIQKENLERTVAELGEIPGGKAHGYLCDVTDRKKVYAVAKQVQAEVGPVDILINNAGIVSGASFLDLPDEKIELSFGVNTMALFWTCKAFLPGMLERNRGHVVTVASAAGLMGVAKLTDYCASKHAAVGFDESLRVELKKRGAAVRTTVVCPYYINTGMFRGVKTRFPFLLPILEEDDVAEKIVRAVHRDRPRLCMPFLVNTIPPLRIVPIAIFDWVASFLGINESMEHFVGRKGGAS